MPKAVRCTQGRMARSGAHVANITEQRDGDAGYAPLPLFHTASLFTGWASTLNAGTAFGTRTRFSASRAVSRSEEHTSELQSLMRIPYAGFCLKIQKKEEDQTQK